MIKHAHWKKRLAVALTGGLLMLNTVVALAAPVELTLEDSIAMALNSNPAIKMTDADRKSAELQIKVAKSGNLPALAIVHNDTLAHSGVDKVTDFNTSVSLGINLYTGGKTESDVSAAKLKLKVADSAVEQSKQKIKLDATNGYFTILQTKNALKVSQEAVDQMEAHLKNVQAQYAVGTVAKSDVLRSEVELANNQQALIKAKNAYDLAISNLNNIIGLPLDTEVTVKDELKHERYTMALADSIQYALAHRPEAIQADYNIDVQKEAVKGAESGKLPTVSANATTGWQDKDFPGADNNSWSIGLKATWTPFDSGVTNAKIKQSDSAVVKATEQARQTKDSVQLDVRQAYLNMSEAEKRIDTNQVAVEKGEEDFKIAQVRYSAGVGTNIDVIDAQVALTQAKNNYIQAMYDFNTSKANLIKAMGVPVVEVKK
ncbi:TolC family protein [Pelosinus sp. IPA-1]|uniref:TolC family protein n=1 Tax=Pelosinus sp. IPA-1 TaxID=3029569 RepID=UPI0024362639|nr:TolC family protein [Pelosinus sp. IPA-1]GMB01318.1 transporter [Pelosinus sp. IPA-1]